VGQHRQDAEGEGPVRKWQRGREGLPLYMTGLTSQAAQRILAGRPCQAER
jgi:hypothetical protein